MAEPVTITLDETAVMMLNFLRETQAEEPKIDLDVQDNTMLAEASLHHYNWSRKLDACYLMLSSRLRGLIDEQLLR